MEHSPHSPFEKLTVLQLHNYTYNRTGRFITGFKWPCYLSRSWVRWIHPSSHPVSLTSILIQTSHLCLGSPSSFPTKTLYAYTCPAHLILLAFITREVKPWSSSLSNFLQSPVSSSTLGPSIFLNILLSNTPQLMFHNVSDDVSHPQSNKQNYFNCILNLMSLDSKDGEKDSWLSGSRHSLKLISS